MGAPDPSSSTVPPPGVLYQPSGSPGPPPSTPFPVTAPPGAAPPVPLPPSHRKLWIGILGAVAVVIVIVLAVLFVTGAFSSHASGPTGTPLAYSQALSPAQSVSVNETGGPWTLVAAEGIGVKSAVSAPNIAGTVGSGCTSSLATGAPASYTMDATPSSATPGEVAAWVFIAANPSNDTLLLIGVNASSAVPLGLVSNCSSISEFTGMGPIVGLTVVNATVVAASFNLNGGSSFLRSTSVSYQAFVLFGNSSLFNGEALWVVLYSTCSLTATSGTGTLLAATYTATTGANLTSPTQEPEDC